MKVGQFPRGALGGGALLALALGSPECFGRVAPGGAPEARRAESIRSKIGKDDLASSLESLVPRLMKEGDVPGLSLAVVRDGRVLYHRAFGVKDTTTGAGVDDETIRSSPMQS